MLINHRRAFRSTDPTAHCGGSGQLVSGSPNVLVGDEIPGFEPCYWINVCVVNAFGEPIPGVSYEVSGPQSFSGSSEQAPLMKAGIPEGKYTLKLLGFKDFVDPEPE